jgi:hypothetical protein
MEYEMTDDELKELLDASKPVPYLIAGGREPTSQQERVNLIWEHLGKKRGFDPYTVKPVPGKEQRFFTADPIEYPMAGPIAD